jgi:murein DD-endopeptidase MepM/ murein hydrolase activator NlpD
MRRGRLTAALALIVALTLVGSLALHRALRRGDGGSAALEAAAQEETASVPLLCLHRGTVERGVSLFDELVASGVSAGETERLMSALSGVLDMRRLKTGESYEVLTEEDGSIASFTYVKSVRERISASQSDGRFDCKVIETPLEERFVRIEGTIHSSLWESMVGQGVSPEIAVKLADVFAWEIDFLTEPRDGDTYVLLAQEFCLGDEVIDYGDIMAARYDGRSRSWTAIGFVGDDGSRQYFSPDGRSVKRAFLKSPLNYRRISSYYTNRRFHPILKKYRPHRGVDYAAAKGTPVVALGDGVVVRAGRNGGFGNYVEIRHNSVYSTCYGHLSKYGRGIRKGVRVAQNQVIGYVGATGLATGPHLDFRVKKNGSYVNPLKLESPRSEPVAKADMARFNLEVQWASWALDYLPAGYAADAHELRTSLLASSSPEAEPPGLQ